jgi:hypothetical protein
MDQELKEYLDQSFSRMDQRLSGMDERLSGVEGRLSGVEDKVHQALVLIEGQRDDIRQVAEGVIGSNERLDAFRAEVTQQFEQVRSLIAPPLWALDSRVKILESWKERTDRDPVEIVRERFGRPKTT